MREVLKDRALGMLLGSHCGDSLGATIEFEAPSSHPMAHKDITGGGPFHWAPGAATDDTDLMLAVLEALQSREIFDFNILKTKLIQWADTGPKDIGQTTQKGIENLKRGLPLRECGYRHPSMFGNGSIMRVAPLALYEGRDLEEVITTQCLMTHGHELCVQTDLVYVKLLRSLLYSTDIPACFEEFKKHIPDIPLLADILERSVTSSWQNLNASGHAAWTLGAGLWALQQTVSQGLTPEDALIQVANRGDDSDTCAAVAGAILGAAYGVGIWPQRWLHTLEKKHEIESHIERL